MRSACIPEGAFLNLPVFDAKDLPVTRASSYTEGGGVEGWAQESARGKGKLMRSLQRMWHWIKKFGP